MSRLEVGRRSREEASHRSRPLACTERVLKKVEDVLSEAKSFFDFVTKNFEMENESILMRGRYAFDPTQAEEVHESLI